MATLNDEFHGFRFIFEAYYAYPEIVEDTFTPRSDSLYAIQKEDNSYDIYFGDFFIENTNSLEYHPGIQIYTEKEYSHEEH